VRELLLYQVHELGGAVVASVGVQLGDVEKRVALA
jgi:hypothetical protein